MRIRMKDTGKVVSVNKSYAARLIEQGAAVPVIPAKRSRPAAENA